MRWVSASANLATVPWVPGTWHHGLRVLLPYCHFLWFVRMYQQHQACEPRGRRCGMALSIVVAPRPCPSNLDYVSLTPPGPCPCYQCKHCKYTWRQVTLKMLPDVSATAAVPESCRHSHEDQPRRLGFPERNNHLVTCFRSLWEAGRRIVFSLHMPAVSSQSGLNRENPPQEGQKTMRHVSSTNGITT